MSSDRHARQLDELHRDLDLVVYRLEQALPEDVEEARRAWTDVRRRLGRLKDRLGDLVREL